MKHCLSGLFLLGSMLLLLAVVVVWVRSYWVTDYLIHAHSRLSADGSLYYRSALLRASHGELGICLRSSFLPQDQFRTFGIKPDQLGNWPLKYSTVDGTGRLRWGTPDGCTRDLRFGSFQFGATVPHPAPQFFKHGIFLVLPL